MKTYVELSGGGQYWNICLHWPCEGDLLNLFMQSGGRNMETDDATKQPDWPEETNWFRGQWEGLSSVT